MGEGEQSTTSQAFFESIYRAHADPWSFATDPYEQSRYRHTMATLGGRTFRRACEPGCSVGVLTEMLAPRCREVWASDLSAVAVDRAQARCRRFDHVRVEQHRFPDDLTRGPFDLIVLSEISYYLSADELAGAIDRVADVATSDATLLAVHWLGTSPDHVLHGSDVHLILRDHPRWIVEGEACTPSYLISYHRPSSRP